MATHLKISERRRCIMWIITKFSGLTLVLHPLRSKRSQFTGLACSFVTGSHSVTHGQLRQPQHTWVKRTAHLKLNRTFKVIQGHPYWCQQKSRTVYCRNVPLMPTLFLKRTKIWQRENGEFVDFNDPTQVWRRPSKKRLRISTNDLYCQKLKLLNYILAADSMVGLCSLVFA